MNVGSYFGNSWIGLFVKTNNSISLVPIDCPEKLCAKIETALKTTVVRTSVAETNLVGVYTAMNSNGIIVPNLATENEIINLRKLGINVYASKDKHNAIGNNLAVNDKSGVINEAVSLEEKKNIEDTLGIELQQQKMGGYTTIGSCCIANNKGFLLHYKASEKEIEEVKAVFRIPGNKGTVNMGTGFVSIGLICNDTGYLAGEATSAHELGRVEEALGFL